MEPNPEDAKATTESLWAEVEQSPAVPAEVLADLAQATTAA